MHTRENNKVSQTNRLASSELWEPKVQLEISYPYGYKNMKKINLDIQIKSVNEGVSIERKCPKKRPEKLIWDSSHLNNIRKIWMVGQACAIFHKHLLKDVAWSLEKYSCLQKTEPVRGDGQKRCRNKR